MATASLYWGGTASSVSNAFRPIVCSLTSREWLHDIDVIRIQNQIGSTPGSAVLRLSGAAMESATNDYGTLIDAWLDERIVIWHVVESSTDLVPIYNRVIFVGTITAIRLAGSPQSEDVILIAQDDRRLMNSTAVQGQWYKYSSGGAWYESQVDIAAVMNPEGEGNCDWYVNYVADSHGPRHYVFGPSAERDDDNAWTLARALNYIALLDGPNYLDYDGNTASVYAFQNITGDTVLDDTNSPILPAVKLEGLDQADAMTAVCASVKHCWWLEPSAQEFVYDGVDQNFNASSALVVEDVHDGVADYMRLPARLTQSADPDSSWTNALSASASTGRSVNRVLAVGQHNAYEHDWILTEGWTANEQGVIDGDNTKGNRSRASASDLAAYDHVYRRWVLDEDGTYGATGTSQCTVVFALGSETTYLRHRRKFESPYHATGEEPHPMAVFIKASTLDSNWHRVISGAVKNLEDRAGISFDVGSIDGADKTQISVEYSSSRTGVAAKHITDVKVCACLRSDMKCRYDATRQDNAASRYEISEVVSDPTFRRVYRTTSSSYAQAGTGWVVDHTSDLQALAEARREKTENLSVSASFVLPWIDFDIRLNSQVSGIDEPEESGVTGRQIYFDTSRDPADPQFPRIVAIVWDFAGQQTEIVTTDEREMRT